LIMSDSFLNKILSLIIASDKLISTLLGNKFKQFLKPSALTLFLKSKAEIGNGVIITLSSFSQSKALSHKLCSIWIFLAFSFNGFTLSKASSNASAILAIIIILYFV